jgi:hypothetical protein
VKRFARFFYTKRKEGEKELDSEETERESVCARGRELRQEVDSVTNKTDH